MKKIAVRILVMGALAAGASTAPAQVYQNPVGTPNVGGCAPPRQWTMRNGWYQCLMPPVAPGGGSPGGSSGGAALTDSDFALICSRYAVSKGFNLNPYLGDPRRTGDDQIFIAADRTPSGLFGSQTAMGPGPAFWSQCQTDGRPDAYLSCGVNSAGSVVSWAVSYATCYGNGG